MTEDTHEIRQLKWKLKTLECIVMDQHQSLSNLTREVVDQSKDIKSLEEKLQVVESSSLAEESAP